jgi:hypothetical protein
VNEQLAAATLTALAQVPGALKVITNEVLPSLRKDEADPRSPIRADVLAVYPDALRRVSTFVLHDVVEITGPDERGRYRARTAEGDWTEGHPAALLRRLQEWQAG